MPSKDGGWDVKKAGAGRASAHPDAQAEAIIRAKEIVHNAGGGEIAIHGRDGRIRDSDTVAPGNDPNPPRDTKQDHGYLGLDLNEVGGPLEEARRIEKRKGAAETAKSSAETKALTKAAAAVKTNSDSARRLREHEARAARNDATN